MTSKRMKLTNQKLIEAIRSHLFLSQDNDTDEIAHDPNEAHTNVAPKSHVFLVVEKHGCFLCSHLRVALVIIIVHCRVDKWTRTFHGAKVPAQRVIHAFFHLVHPESSAQLGQNPESSKRLFLYD